MTVVDKNEFPVIVKIYNEQGRKSAYEYIRQTYGLKRPYFVINRINKTSEYNLDKETDQFVSVSQSDGDELFMSLDELCGKKQDSDNDIDTKGYELTMESLIHSLVSDRLLEISRYISLDSQHRQIIIDRTSMTNDGYTIMVH